MILQNSIQISDTRYFLFCFRYQDVKPFGG